MPKNIIKLFFVNLVISTIMVAGGFGLWHSRQYTVGLSVNFKQVIVGTILLIAVVMTALVQMVNKLSKDRS